MSPGRPPKYSRPLARVGLSDAVARLPETDLLAGQDLRDAGAFSVTDKGQGLWVGSADGVEVELQLNGRKLRDYVCECTDFAERDSCAHFAALLAKVHLLKQAKPRKPKARTAQTVSTTRVLKAVSDHELREFVQRYASTHPEFSFDLKLHFAQALPIANRFEQVIKNLLKRSTAQYSARQGKRITEALRRFAQQRELWLADKAYLDLFELNTTLAERLILVLNKSDRVGLDLPAYIAGLLSELREVVTGSPPPVLIERIDGWVQDQLEIGAYFRYGLDAGLYRLIADLRTAEEALAQITRANARYGESEARLQSEIELLYASGDADSAERLLIGHLGSPTLVFAALGREVAAENYRRAIRLAEAALSEDIGEAYAAQLRVFICQAAATTQLPEPLVAHAPEVIVDQVGYEVLQGASAWLSDAALDSIYAQVLQRLPGAKLRPDQLEGLRAETLLKQNAYRALEALIYRSANDSLVAEYLPQLANRLPNEDYELLAETKVREHLSGRFGKAPAEWVSSLLAEIARRSRTDVTSSLVGRVRAEYKQRHALMDALDQALL